MLRRKTELFKNNFYRNISQQKQYFIRVSNKNSVFCFILRYFMQSLYDLVLSMFLDA